MGAKASASVAEGSDGAGQEGVWMTRAMMIAAAKQPKAISDAMPPTIAWPNARPSAPRTLDRQIPTSPRIATAEKTSPRTTAPDASSGIWLASRTVIA